MADEKHESKRSCYSRHKWLPAAAAILLLVFLAAGFSFRYISFMSQTIYQESTSHLEEVLYKSNSMLKEMVRKNLTYLHLCNGFLKNTSNEDEIQAYIEEAQQATGFVNFYFLSYDGNYMTVTGGTGYLGLQTNLDEKLSDGEDIVVNTALPGKAPMLAFICPETQGSYRGFAYDAVAITYYNDAVLRLLDSSAFQGNASNYVIYPDGRVVIDNSVNRKEIIYNFIAMLRDHSDLSEEQILALSDDFAQGRSGNLRVKLGDTSYYLVYEDTAVQNWTMVGLVPVSIVNASLDKLWFHTVQIVAGIAFGLAVLIILLILRRSHTTLRRKDTEILYRDELFQKLSLNVDDVFLMLDAKTSKVDYVSPNVERLLGIPWKEVRQDARALAALHPKDDPDRDKNFLEGLLSGQQREWDFEFEHRETKERRWFHNIAMGSGNVTLMLLFTAIAALGQGPWQGDMNAVIAACSEYTWLTKHKRVDGTMYSCTSLGVKLGGGLGTAITGWLLAASHFDSALAVQPESCISMLKIMYLVIPFALDAIITFILSHMKVEEANEKLRAAV